MPALPPSPAVPPGSDRRAFLTAVAGAALAAGAARGAGADPPVGGAPPAAPVRAPMPQRAFGRTGARVSVFGLGGFPLGGLATDEEGVAVVARALEAGCTYFDTAPSYANGASERRLGLALKGRPRASYFLATKTHTRTAGEARADLEGSLTRLGVQQLDLVQVHAVTDAADLERVLEKDGPLTALVKAREEKLVRFLGFTGHADPDVLRQLLSRFAFDAALFPLNCVDPHHLSFEAGFLPAAVEQGLARVAMKVFASGKLPTLGIDARDCLRYVYAQDVSTVVVGCRTRDEVALAADVAAEQRPLTPEQARALLARTQPHQGKGTEWYKRA